MQRLATAAAKAFYHNIRDGKAAQNMALFYMPDISIGVIDRWPTQTKWAQHTPAEYLRQHGDEPRYFEVDTVDTQVVHEELAVARVSWRAGGVKGVSVITLTGLDGKWRIASLFEETAFVW